MNINKELVQERDALRRRVEALSSEVTEVGRRLEMSERAAGNQVHRLTEECHELRRALFTLIEKMPG